FWLSFFKNLVEINILLCLLFGDPPIFPITSSSFSHIRTQTPGQCVVTNSSLSLLTNIHTPTRGIIHDTREKLFLEIGFLLFHLPQVVHQCTGCSVGQYFLSLFKCFLSPRVCFEMN